MVRERLSKNNSIGILMLSSLLLLPSCGLTDWIKDKFGGGSCGHSQECGGVSASDKSDVLATLAGKPLITRSMLDTEKQRLIESNPQLQAMIALMDERQLDRNLMDGLASREAIREYIRKNKIAESEKYRKDFDMVLGQVRDALNTRYFMEAFAEKADDAEVQAYYDANKSSMPNLLISRGGVAAMAVPFKDRQEAKDFAAKVKAANNDITKAAKQANIESKVKDLRLVNEESVGLDDEVKSRISAIDTFPRVEVVKAGNEYWTVAASRREDAKYRPFEQVKLELKQAIEKDKTMKRFEQEVARLKDEYQIQVNETFFTDAPIDNSAAVTAENSQTPAQESTVAESEGIALEEVTAANSAAESTEQSAASTQVA